MSTIYQCVDCSQHYCADCDGGEDACVECHTGPRCHDCAVDHDAEEREQNGLSDDEDEALPLCALAMGCLCAAHAKGRDASGPCDANEDVQP